MQGGSPEAFEALFNQHVQRLGPAGGVELGMVREMAAARWRLRRVWTIETSTFDKEVAAQTAGDQLDRMAAAFASLAAKPSAALLHRYEMRLHLIYNRTLQNLLLLRLAPALPNEPTMSLKTMDRPCETGSRLGRAQPPVDNKWSGRRLLHSTLVGCLRYGRGAIRRQATHPLGRLRQPLAPATGPMSLSTSQIRIRKPWRSKPPAGDSAVRVEEFEVGH
jgi:hypothetical protein